MVDESKRHISLGCGCLLLGAPLFAIFLIIDFLWGAQLGIYPTGDSGPVITTPMPAPSSPYPWLTTTPPPWKPAPRYTGPGSHCRDGTHSNSRGRGTCSHHGGVE